MLNDPIKSSGIDQGAQISNDKALEWIRIPVEPCGVLKTGSGVLGGGSMWIGWISDPPLGSARHIFSRCKSQKSERLIKLPCIIKKSKLILLIYK